MKHENAPKPPAQAESGQREDGSTLGQKVAQAEPQTGQARAATEATAERAPQGAENASQVPGNTVADAAVAAGMNADLPQDPAPSTLKLDGETQQGRERLSGRASSEDAREPASGLASGVSGAQSVGNALKAGR